MSSSKSPSPVQTAKALGRQLGRGFKGGAVGTCLSTALVRARVEHEKSGEGGDDEGKGRKRRRWRTDGCGSEVDGGQPAAGRLRESGHHAGQGPVLSLQPLLDLPQGLNLLYLGEVLQGDKQDQRSVVGGLMEDGRTETKRGEGPTGGREEGERQRSLLEDEGRLWNWRNESEFCRCWWTEWKHE